MEELKQPDTSSAKSVMSQNSNEEIIETEQSHSFGKYRKWLRDRVFGKSNYGGDSHPPAACCLPPPLLLLTPYLCEENWLFRALGKIGLRASAADNTIRCLFLRLGMMANLSGLILTILSCFAMSKNFYYLNLLPFSSANVIGLEQFLKIHVGLRAIAVKNMLTSDVKIIPFDKICSDEWMVENCNKCQNVSASMVGTIISSAVAFLPSIFTDTTRMYINYDVNCQKMAATIFALISLALSLITMMEYRFLCYVSFYKGLIYLDEEDEIVEAFSETAVKMISFDWNVGAGFTCLILGSLLKIVDICCNFLVQTPTITRDAKEQFDYEKIPSVLKEADCDEESVLNEADCEKDSL